MKKIILLTLIMGVYTIPASASDVDSDYASSTVNSTSPSHHLLSNEESVIQDLALETVDAGDVKTDAQHYDKETPWVGATYQVGSDEPTHRYPFDDFGYDEE